MITDSKSNLCIHPNLDRGYAAILNRLAARLAEERLVAIAAIEHAIADLEQHPPEGPPGTAETLIARFQIVLSEIEAIDPAFRPDAEHFEGIARRLQELTEMPRAYLLLSRAGSLKK